MKLKKGTGDVADLHSADDTDAVLASRCDRNNDYSDMKSQFSLQTAVSFVLYR